VTLRNMVLVFFTPACAAEFFKFARAFFYGSLDGGAELDGVHVRIRGMRAGEAGMLAREAQKQGGYIELQQQPNIEGDRPHA